MRKRWTFAIGWEHDGVCDADEVTVMARNAQEAEAAATQKWLRTIGAEWPGVNVCQAILLRGGGVCFLK